MSLVDMQRGAHRHVPYRDSRLTYLLQVLQPVTQWCTGSSPNLPFTRFTCRILVHVTLQRYSDLVPEKYL